MRNITLCADDFGLNAEISSAIIDLINSQRISATSCLTTLPDWQISGKKLVEFHKHIDIGLHFNLTEGPSATNIKFITHDHQFISLKNTIIRAYLHQLSKKDIEKELIKQLNAFVDVCGFLPDFIDGHQHIHQLPIIRDALINVYCQKFPNRNAYIRIPSNGLLYTMMKSLSLKAIFIAGLGANSLLKTLDLYRIPYNSSFFGIYNFNDSANYRSHFIRFLKFISTNGLIMCHPGYSLTTTHNNDMICNARASEYQYFKSEHFISDCKQANIALSRFNSLR